MPNYFAKRLRTNRTKQIAMTVPTLYDEFTPALIDGAKSVMMANGYNLFVLDFNPDRYGDSIDAIRAPLMLLLGGGIDGVISDVGKQISDVVQQRVPMVHIDDVVEGAPCVSVDTYTAMYQITELFLKRGCRRIAFIGARYREGFSHTYVARHQGYEQAMTDYGVPVDKQLEKFVAPTYAGGFEAFDWLMSMPTLPEAVVIFTDVVAHIIQQRLVQSGVSIPEQIGLASMDDTFSSKLMCPPLTSVHIPAFDMGSKAAEMLLDLIDGKEPEKLNYVVEIELHERESSRVPLR